MRDKSYLPIALAALFCLGVYCDAIPYNMPLFVPSALCLALWFGLIRRRACFPVNMGILLFSGVLVLYLVGMLRSGTIYFQNRRDLQNALGILLITPVMFSQSASEVRRFQIAVQRACVIVCTPVALFSLYKFELLTAGVSLDWLRKEGRYPWGSSLTEDYNFFAFAMLVGAISSVFWHARSNTIRGQAFCMLSFLISAVAMLLSGSRRGWVTEAMLLAGVIGLLLWKAATALANAPTALANAPTALANAPTAIHSMRGRGLRTIIALLIVVGITTVVTYRLTPLMQEPTHGGQNQVKDLFGRFMTLDDPSRAFNERSSRWDYSFKLLQHAGPAEALFGQGFGYLRGFASAFQTQTEEDYPHNPLISAALYSGLVGAIWAMLLLIAAAIRYVGNGTRDMYFGLLYVAALWFVLPSFHSLLSGKLFLWLLIMPWLTKRGTEPTIRYEGIAYCPESLYAR